MTNQQSVWKHKSTFILAAAGAAIGLGNIWKFPYVAASNGGSAFVLIYIICVFLIGLPIMMSETIIGKYARGNAYEALRKTAIQSSKSKNWSLIAVLGFVCLFFLFSFYSVVAGWSLDYTVDFLKGEFTDKTGEQVAGSFAALQASVPRLIAWHTAFVFLTSYIIARGVKSGIERSLQLMMPILVLLVLAMVLYGMFATDEFTHALQFLFAFDFSKITVATVIDAMGQAFFSLSLGMCAIMTYASYMRQDVSIAKSAVIVVILDTSIALLAGLAIFPVVFDNGLEVSGDGPGLLFITLSTAFAKLPFGSIIGAVFFFLIFIAAISSSISMVEPIVKFVTERYKITRVRFTSLYGVCVWMFGLLTVFSFNIWSDVDILGTGKTPFGLLDYTVSNIFLPIGGLLIAIYSGWFLDKKIAERELACSHPLVFQLWRLMVRYVAPFAILIILLSAIS